MKTLFWLVYILSFIVFVISSILWNLYEVGGISIYISLHIFFFFKYFQGKECAYAIKIRDLKVLTKSIDPKKVIEDFTPPQSYKYIEREIVIDEKFCRMVQG